MTLLEYLLEKNKNKILNSIYQNTIYNGKTLCEYFGVESKSKKPGKEFSELIFDIIYDLPEYNYKELLENIDKYKKHPNLYLRCGYKLIQIKDILTMIDKYKDGNEIPVSFYPPTFFSRCYKIVWYNKITGESEIKYCKSKTEYTDAFCNALRMDIINILNDVSYDDYKELL